jgi:predicted ATPase with chaperone activity
MRRAVIAAQNAAEAAVVPGVAVAPCDDLRAVLACLRGQSFPPQAGIAAAATSSAAAPSKSLVAVVGDRRWRSEVFASLHS